MISDPVWLINKSNKEKFCPLDLTGLVVHSTEGAPYFKRFSPMGFVKTRTDAARNKQVNEEIRRELHGKP